RSRTSGKTRPRPSSVISGPRRSRPDRAARVATAVARAGARRRVGDRTGGRAPRPAAASALGRPTVDIARRGSGVEGIRRSALDSGLRVVTEALPGLRSVTIGAWVGTGSPRGADVPY